MVGIRARMPHAGRYTTAAPPRTAKFQFAARRLNELGSQHDPRRGRRLLHTARHTRHTRRRLLQFIWMVPKTAATGARQHHPSAIGRGIYQSTSLLWVIPLRKYAAPRCRLSCQERSFAPVRNVLGTRSGLQRSERSFRNERQFHASLPPHPPPTRLPL